MASTPSAADVATNSPVNSDSIATWVAGYIKAWETNAAADIAALFTEDAEYHETPYETKWIGLDEIVEGWRSRWEWQMGGWVFDWAIASVDNRTVVITGVGRYKKLGDFDNTWTVTFHESGRVSRFEMLNTERA